MLFERKYDIIGQKPKEPVCCTRIGACAGVRLRECGISVGTAEEKGGFYGFGKAF